MKNHRIIILAAITTTALAFTAPSAKAIPVTDIVRKIEQMLGRIKEMQSQIEILQYYENVKETYETVGGQYIDNNNNIYANKIAREDHMQSNLSELSELKESLPVANCDALYQAYLEKRNSCLVSEYNDAIANKESLSNQFIIDLSETDKDQAVKAKKQRSIENAHELSKFNNESLLSGAIQGPFKSSIPINTEKGLQAFAETIAPPKETSLNPSLKENNYESLRQQAEVLRVNAAYSHLSYNLKPYLRTSEAPSSIELSDSLAKQVFSSSEHSVLEDLKTIDTTESQAIRYLGYLLAAKINYSLQEFHRNTEKEVLLALSLINKLKEDKPAGIRDIIEERRK